MANVLQNYLASPLSHDECACVYSALILVDDDLPITEDKIKTLLKAANVDVEPIWPSLFAKALQGINVKELITGAGGAAAAMVAGGAQVGAVPAGGATGQPAEEEKKEAAPPPPEDDDSDEDFGLSLFD